MIWDTTFNLENYQPKDTGKDQEFLHFPYELDGLCLLYVHFGVCQIIFGGMCSLMGLVLDLNRSSPWRIGGL